MTPVMVSRKTRIIWSNESCTHALKSTAPPACTSIMSLTTFIAFMRSSSSVISARASKKAALSSRNWLYRSIPNSNCSSNSFSLANSMQWIGRYGKLRRVHLAMPTGSGSSPSL